MFKLLRVIFGLSWICFFPTSLCGVLVLDCALLSAPLASCLTPTRTQPHKLLTHNLLTHTAYSHTSHTLTHNLLTTQLTHNLLTTYSQLTHTHTHAHTAYSHTTHIHSPPTHNSPTHKLSLCVAGVFLVTSSFTLSGKRGTDGAGLALVARLVPVCRRGRRGSLCVAGLALGDVDLQFVWQAWRLWYWVGWWHAWFPFVPEDAAAVCVADVAFGSIDLHSVRQTWHLATSAWQAWRLWCWADSGGALVSRLSPRTRRLFVWQAWHLEASASILCGGRGAWQHRPSLCVAGVALMALGWLWWRAWLQLFLEASTSILCLHFVWQAWPLWYWAGSGGTLGSRLSPRKRGCLCGRRGIWKHRPPFCVVGVALGDIDLHLTCRAKRQPSASAMNLLQTLRPHDTLRGLLGHIAHAAKTGGCHSPLLMARYIT